ncbi:MAG TPA: hypothetical protein VHE79_00160 [Spirochaetia bacterium]
MKTMSGLATMLAAMAAALLLVSCTTFREKTDPYIFGDAGRLDAPFDAWLRTIEVVSNNLPLSEDYGIIGDSLVAVASRYGVRLSRTQGSQPYVVDLVIHEHTYAVDVSTTNAVMAVLNVSESTAPDVSVARVVHSAVTPDSIVSLYEVARIDELLFSALRQQIGDSARAAREAAAKQTQPASQ